VDIDVTHGTVSVFGVGETGWTTAGVRVLFSIGHDLFIPSRFLHVWAVKRKTLALEMLNSMETQARDEP
jgi:hypothetical protein